jgi:hypothetical protein
MYPFPARLSTNAETDRGFWSDSRFGKKRAKVRPRARRARFLLYAGLLAGFCVLLAFAGCGSNTGARERAVAGNAAPACASGAEHDGIAAEIAPRYSAIMRPEPTGNWHDATRPKLLSIASRTASRGERALWKAAPRKVQDRQPSAGAFFGKNRRFVPPYGQAPWLL